MKIKQIWRFGGEISTLYRGVSKECLEICSWRRFHREEAEPWTGKETIQYLLAITALFPSCGSINWKRERERRTKLMQPRSRAFSLFLSLSLIFLFHWRHLKISKIFNGSDSFTPSTCMRQRIHRRFIRSLFSFVPFFWCKINHFYS